MTATAERLTFDVDDQAGKRLRLGCRPRPRQVAGVVGEPAVTVVEQACQQAERAPAVRIRTRLGLAGETHRAGELVDGRCATASSNEYHLLRAKAQFRGEDYGTPIAVTICDRSQWKFSSTPVAISTVKTAKDQADFHFEAAHDNKPAVSFTVRYHLSGATLTVTLEDVQEHEETLRERR